jgi:hypothetical protein
VLLHLARSGLKRVVGGLMPSIFTLPPPLSNGRQRTPIFALLVKPKLNGKLQSSSAADRFGTQAELLLLPLLALTDRVARAMNVGF